MGTDTLTLTAFLLARIAEDEEWLRASARQIAIHPTVQQEPARMLAKCEADRRIVGIHPVDDEGVYDADGIEHPGLGCRGCWDDFPCATIRALALPYVAHENYRPEWRP